MQSRKRQKNEKYNCYKFIHWKYAKSKTLKGLAMGLSLECNQEKHRWQTMLMLKLILC